MKNKTTFDILQDMDQFNKVLAAFLILIVGVGLAIFIFARLGVLNRIIPATTPKSANVVIQNSPTSKPTQSPSPAPKERQGVLGWLSQFGKAKNNTPTPTNPVLAISTAPTNKGISLQTTSPSPTTPTTLAVTIIPYGANSASTYPASGLETALIPFFIIILLAGLYLRRRSI
jgi:hypothetical protein